MKMDVLNYDSYYIEVAKALGWYQWKNKRLYTQTSIATKVGRDASGISKYLIGPSVAKNIFDEKTLKQRGKIKITMDIADSIAKAMDSTVLDILFYYKHQEIYEEYYTKCEMLKNINSGEVNNKEKSKLLTNNAHYDFLPWYGKYYCYFSSTSSDEAGKRREDITKDVINGSEEKELYDIIPQDYLFCGILSIPDKQQYEDEKCHVEFRFMVDKNSCKVKRYQGVLTLSRDKNAGFIELRSQEEGEISYIIVEKPDSQKLKCCMAMVVTLSSKHGHRRPCCEKMLITDLDVKNGTEGYEALKANLLMNDSIIRIKKSDYIKMVEEMRNTLDEDLSVVLSNYENFQDLADNTIIIEECMFIPEASLMKIHKLTKKQRTKFKLLLRKYSMANWYYKVNKKSAEEILVLNRQNSIS